MRSFKRFSKNLRNIVRYVRGNQKVLWSSTSNQSTCSDSSDSSSESSEHSDTDNIIIISDSDDNDSIDSGVQNDTNDFTSTLTKYLQRNQKKNDESIIGQPIPETQNHGTENIIPLELFHEDEVKEPKPLIIFYYECPITSGKCQKWRSIEDVYSHVEAHAKGCP